MSEPIQSYADFTGALRAAGFSMGGGNSEGIYSVLPWSWDETPPYPTSIRWFSGDPELDPWEWRMRVLEENLGIAYAKLFFGKSGFLTAEWAPYFLAVRRGSRSLRDEYEDGEISHTAKRIYDVVTDNGALAFHTIKQLGGFAKGDGPAFERALGELQRKMYLTMSGRQQKLSRMGLGYGWASTVFCTVERFFGEEILSQAQELSEQEAIGAITGQILQLNPAAETKRILKFIKG